MAINTAMLSVYVYKFSYAVNCDASSKMTPCITTLRIMTHNIMGLFVILSINDTQHNSIESHYAECCGFYCYAESRYSECRYAECRYDKCRYAEYRYAKFHLC